MNKKVIAALIAVSVVCGQGAVVFANPASSTQIQESRNEYNTIQQKIAELEQQLNIIDDEVGSMNQVIEGNNQEIAALQGKVAETEAAIEQAKIVLKEKQDAYDARMRAIYKTGGQNNYVTLLFEAEGFSDLIARIQAIGKLMGMDQQIIEDLNNQKEVLDNKVAELESQVKEVETLKAQNQVKLDELNLKLNEQNSLVSQAKTERAKIVEDLDTREWSLVQYYVGVINNSSSSESDIRNSVNTLVSVRSSIVSPNIDAKVSSAITKGTNRLKQIEAAKNTPSRGETGSASATSLISYAYKFLGTPYVWGGTTPSGFDCSGFTQYVFRHFGYSIGRTTYDQIKSGRAVSRANMQPGDLIFTHSGHVGIYIGNNRFIHAPHTGDVVKVSSVYAFYAARRILN